MPGSRRRSTRHGVWWPVRTHFGSSLSWQASYYRCGFPAWISDWRAKSTAPHTRGLAFLYVQLAPHESGALAWSFIVSLRLRLMMVIDGGAGVLSGLAELRQAQDAALRLPLVGMASAVDLGDPLRTRAHPQQLPTVPPHSHRQSFSRILLPAQQERARTAPGARSGPPCLRIECLRSGLDACTHTTNDHASEPDDMLIAFTVTRHHIIIVIVVVNTPVPTRRCSACDLATTRGQGSGLLRPRHRTRRPTRQLPISSGKHAGPLSFCLIYSCYFVSHIVCSRVQRTSSV